MGLDTSPSPTFTATYATVEGHDLPLDVYVPADSSPTYAAARPLLLLFHGGGFILGSRRTVALLQVSAALARGWLVASASYRLAPAASINAGCIPDARAALAWSATALTAALAAHGRPLAVDVARIVVSGASAGGTLALATAFGPPGPARPAAVIDFYGAKHFELAWRAPVPPAASEADVPQVSDDEMARLRATPLATDAADDAELRRRYLSRVLAQGRFQAAVLPDGDFQAMDALLNVARDWPPVWIAHSTSDTGPTMQASEALVARCDDAGVPAKLVRVECAEHAFLQDMAEGEERFAVHERVFDEVEALWL